MEKDDYKFIFFIEGQKYDSIQDYKEKNIDKDPMEAYKIKFSNPEFMNALIGSKTNNIYLNSIQDSIRNKIAKCEKVTINYVFFKPKIKLNIKNFINKSYYYVYRPIYALEKIKDNIYIENEAMLIRKFYRVYDLDNDLYLYLSRNLTYMIISPLYNNIIKFDLKNFI